LALIGIGLVTCAGLWVLLHRTNWGVQVRAATVDREMLQSLGVNVRRLFTTVFGLGAGLAGLAGGLAAPIMSVGPGLHAQVLIDAFLIVVIGGMGRRVRRSVLHSRHSAAMHVAPLPWGWTSRFIAGLHLWSPRRLPGWLALCLRSPTTTSSPVG
jgi:hypothetical protein